MAGNIPPQFLKNVKGKKASAKAGATSKNGPSGKGELPAFLLKKGTAKKGADDSADSVDDSKLTKKERLALARKKAAKKAFGGKDDADTKDAKANPFAKKG